MPPGDSKEITEEISVEMTRSILKVFPRGITEQFPEKQPREFLEVSFEPFKFCTRIHCKE